MQLEIPDSPGVLKRHPSNPVRERSLTAVKRSSYASQIVEESLERVEQDERAMAAARSKRIGSSESSTSISAGLQGGDNKGGGGGEEGGKGEAVSEDYFDVSSHIMLYCYLYERGVTSTANITVAIAEINTLSLTAFISLWYVYILIHFVSNYKVHDGYSNRFNYSILGIYIILNTSLNSKDQSILCIP